MSISSDRLKQLRKFNKKTQAEMAQILGVATSTLSMWEIGQREMDYDTLIKVSQYFNVSIDYLLGNKTNSTLENIDVAFYGQLGDLSEEQKQDVIKYAEFLKQRDASKK